MRVPSPEKVRVNSVVNPINNSQMPNKSMPRFLIDFTLSLLYEG
jgi:hypothetical protein